MFTYYDKTLKFLEIRVKDKLNGYPERLIEIEVTDDILDQDKIYIYNETESKYEEVL